MSPPWPLRLGNNHGRYAGETIDIEAVLAEIAACAQAPEWQVDRFGVPNGSDLLALCRRVPQARRRLYFSSGIHGDEPAPPLAVRQLMRENLWPADVDLWICPCLNPTGFALNRRENREGVDLNRDYRHRQTGEIQAHVAWLEQQPPFDVTLCLHEDWEAHGFYLYELNPDQRPSLAETMIQRVAEVCPIDRSPLIDQRPAANGIIRPQMDPRQRPQWPEAIYLIAHKTRHSYTLEAPSDFPLALRIRSLVTAVRTALT